MFGRLVAFVAATLAALLVGGTVGAASTAGAATYGNKVSTTCNVSVLARAHQPVRARVGVSANASDPIRGRVSITVTGGPSGARVWSTSVRYNGSPVNLTGPALPAGHYQAAARFASGSGVYLDARCSSAFNARAVADEHSGGSGSSAGSGGGGLGGLSGGLPNTGGPSKWWLVLGFGLMLAGGASVYGSRARRHHKVRARTLR